MTKRLLASLLVCAAGSAGAQGVQGPTDPADLQDPFGPGENAPPGTYRPETYGAVGDGASRTAGDALGITTRAQLAAHVVNGATPYAWIGTDLWKNYVNLDVSSAAVIGATTLRFASTAGVAVGMRALGAALAADAR